MCIRDRYNIEPNEIYNLGAQSHVRVSFDIPEYTGDITGLGTTRLLEAIRRSGIKTKFYQASSSELFGSASAPQSETTFFEPQSPYAIAKLYSYWMTRNYRDGYGLFASNGILFNHESPRRGERFVTRKITRALGHILAGKQKKLYLGNMDAKRDWGFAPDYVVMMWLMLQQDTPDDFAVGTGTAFTVRDFVNTSFSYAGVEIEWQGSGEQEKGIIKSLDSKWDSVLKVGDVVVEIDPKYFRPTEVDFLQADISKAKEKLDWEPKVTFHELVQVMTDYDLKVHGLEYPSHGIKAVRSKGFEWTNHELKD